MHIKLRIKKESSVKDLYKKTQTTQSIYFHYEKKIMIDLAQTHSGKC